MSLLLTKNCHYAILVAIEDGQNFIGQGDKDTYVTSRLNLKLPRPVDDLIPPTTLLSTKPTILTDKPEWRTTLVYFVSSQILHRLRKRQAQVTLDVNTLAEEGTREVLGSVVLKMEDARIVMQRGKQDITQIQEFVNDKGTWLPLNENTRSKIKVGLFITVMPQNTDAVDKKFGTPLQRPIRTDGRSHSRQSEPGLEICSNVSELLSNVSENSILLNAEDDEDEELLDESDYEQIHHGDDDDDQEHEEEEEEEEQTIAIGNGLDQYSFEFRIIDAKYISSITEKFPNITEVFFQYEFADKQYQCGAENKNDRWVALEHHRGISIQGQLEDIKAWMEEIAMITVCLIGQDTDGKQELIGFSEVFIKGRDLGIVPLSTLICDCEKTWHINSNKQFSKLQLEVGLTEGWHDDDEEEEE